jgi:hypothetical protein
MKVLGSQRTLADVAREDRAHAHGETRVKKLIAMVLVLSACHSSSPTTRPVPGAAGNMTGAADPIGAVRGFLAAAKQQDLQAMGAMWGSPDGSVREQMDRSELEKRELIMMCYLKHDRYDIVGDAPNPGGTRAAVVNLTFGDITRSTTFNVLKGPADRWYVSNFDMAKLSDICARKG